MTFYCRFKLSFELPYLGIWTPADVVTRCQNNKVSGCLMCIIAGYLVRVVAGYLVCVIAGYFRTFFSVCPSLGNPGVLDLSLDSPSAL